MKQREFISNVGFIYGYKPSGHSVVAQAVSDFLPKDVIGLKHLNLSDIFPDTSRIVVKLYLEIIQKTPTLWSYLYNNSLVSFIHKNVKIGPLTLYTSRLEKIINKNSVDFLVSTHAFSSIIAYKSNIKTMLKKHIAIITDIYAHSFWPSDLDRYFVPHYETYKSLALNGVPQERIEISGMPLRKEFYISYNQKKLRKKLRLRDCYTFLISGGSKGLGDMLSILDVIKNINQKIDVIVMCGSNTKLLKEIRKIRYSGNVRVYPVGYQTNTAVFYAASDCVIGKPGGVTVFEVAALSKPFIVFNAIPGQEERNRDFLKKHSYAICPNDLRELKDAVHSLCTNRYINLKYSHAISSIHRKDANFKIVDYIIRNV